MTELRNLKIYDDSVGPAELDDSTNSIQTIEYEHHEIHSGSHFYVCGFEVIDDGASVIFAVTTPDTAKEPHMTFHITGTSETEMYVYEDSEITGGTGVTPLNNNRRSDIASVVTLAKDPTVNTQGTLIYSQSSGKAGTTPSRADLNGLVARNREIILERNSTTIFEIASNDDGNIVNFCGEWYEHTPKN